MAIENVIGDYHVFVDETLEELDEAGFDRSDFEEIDHLAYSVKTFGRYEELKELISEYGTMISESEHNGRPIAVFRLELPLQQSNYTIYGFELLAPKPATVHKDGLEHLEIVVGDLQRLMESHRSVSFNTKSLSDENNPRVSVDLGRSMVKFHLWPLEDVVRLQKDK